MGEGEGGERGVSSISRIERRHILEESQEPPPGDRALCLQGQMARTVALGHAQFPRLAIQQPGAERGAFDDVEHAQETGRIAHAWQGSRRSGDRGMTEVGKVGMDGGRQRPGAPAAEAAGQGDFGQRGLERLPLRFGRA